MKFCEKLPTLLIEYIMICAWFVRTCVCICVYMYLCIDGWVGWVDRLMDNPADTQRNDNVIMTSKRRRDVIMKSLLAPRVCCESMAQGGAYPLKFHTKYLTHTLKDMIFYAILKFQELLDLRAHKCFWNAPWPITRNNEPWAISLRHHQIDQWFVSPVWPEAITK